MREGHASLLRRDGVQALPFGGVLCDICSVGLSMIAFVPSHRVVLCRLGVSTRYSLLILHYSVLFVSSTRFLKFGKKLVWFPCVGF